MGKEENKKNQDTKAAANSSMVSAPSVSLPKGGGAIRRRPGPGVPAGL